MWFDSFCILEFYFSFNFRRCLIDLEALLNYPWTTALISSNEINRLLVLLTLETTPRINDLLGKSFLFIYDGPMNLKTVCSSCKSCCVKMHFPPYLFTGRQRSLWNWKALSISCISVPYADFSRTVPSKWWYLHTVTLKNQFKIRDRL